MVNETLQDIFDEYYAREAKLEANREIQRLNEENDALQEEIESLEDSVYDRNDTIDEMNYEIQKAQNIYDDIAKSITEIRKTLEILEKEKLADLKWHIDHAKQDW